MPSTSAVRFAEWTSDGPLRWRTCDEVPVLVNPGPAGAAGVDEVRTALARIGELTGVRFVVHGTTDAVPQLDWARTGQVVDGWPYPAVLIAWAADRDTDIVDRSSAAAVANPAEYQGVRQFVSGAVVLNTDQFDRFAPGFGPGATRGNLLLHELGHLVGLEHVRTDDLMNPRVDDASPDGFTAGEQDGMRALQLTCPLPIV